MSGTPSASQPSRMSWQDLAAWHDRQCERFQRRIPPTADDARWLERNARRRKPRCYRVRPSVRTDHPVFEVAGADPAGFVTIINRELTMCVMAAREGEFGPVIDSDEYAWMRIEHLIIERRIAHV
jgi:hypothetical protein